MDLFFFGVITGGVLGFALSRLFSFDAEAPPRRLSADELTAALAPRAAAEPAGTAAARSAPPQASDAADDLRRIEGIGPKIEALLHGAGIRRFAELAAADADHLHAVLAAAGPAFRLANPASWAEQARLAADGRWAELQALQDRLTAGVDRPAEPPAAPAAAAPAPSAAA